MSKPQQIIVNFFKTISLGLLLIGTLQAQALADASYPGTCTPDQKYCAYFAPIDMPMHAVQDLLKSAKHSIRIASYNTSVSELIPILDAQLAAGVKVEFMADFRLSYSSNRTWRNSRAHQNLTKYRTPVFRGFNPQMHNKIIIVDESVVMFGSANFSYNGLVSNYENLMTIRDAKAIAKFSAEVDEIRDISQKFCMIFALNAKDCGQGTETYESNVKNFLERGIFPKEHLKAASAFCKDQMQAERIFLFSPGNQLTNKNWLDCFADQRWIQLVQFLQQRERYADDSLVAESKNTSAHPNNQVGQEIEVYFGPEDNLGRVIVEELHKLKGHGDQAFAYLSTNFITNGVLVNELVELRKQGSRLVVFFDRGRATDKGFMQHWDRLKDFVIVFNNSLTGSYGANHNKFAVLYDPQNGLRLINGSANWSASALGRWERNQPTHSMHRDPNNASNDENVVILRNPEISLIYLREMLSELFVYRDFQNIAASEFQKDLEILTQKFACLKALLGTQASCQTSQGLTWSPTQTSHALVSVANVPVDKSQYNVWAWVPEHSKAYQVFTHDNFNDDQGRLRWLTSLPLALNQEVHFELFTSPKSFDPNAHHKQTGQGPGPVNWETGKNGYLRKINASSLSLHVIHHNPYIWGQQ